MPSPDYFPLSGTSMASAVTSGAAALMLQGYPKMTPDQVKAFLMKDANKTLFPLTSSVTDPETWQPELRTGYGEVESAQKHKCPDDLSFAPKIGEVWKR